MLCGIKVKGDAAISLVEDLIDQPRSRAGNADALTLLFIRCFIRKNSA